MRIVLFDIDGTLLTAGNEARESFSRALSEAAGRPISPDGYSFSGRTDPQIARDILSGHGVEGEALEAGIPRTIELYLRYFSKALPGMRTARLLPGARELLEALAERRGVRTALLTGNVERGARLKLEHFNIDSFFEFSISCFGSDDADRYRLPPLAIERARRLFGREIAPADLVIVGDSEHDVRCAHAVGARAVAVATGWTPIEELRALNPEALLPSFSDTERALEEILQECGTLTSA
jgi:phosphoglycolate phosphatase-like HAD superfamily hydrolase